jgi:hypothetical protein
MRNESRPPRGRSSKPNFCAVLLRWTMVATYLLKDSSHSRASEGLDGVVFPFFHFCLISRRSMLLDDGYGLSSMNTVRGN